MHFKAGREAEAKLAPGPIAITLYEEWQGHSVQKPRHLPPHSHPTFSCALLPSIHPPSIPQLPSPLAVPDLASSHGSCHVRSAGERMDTKKRFTPHLTPASPDLPRSPSHTLPPLA
ncbi:unnamed protein product [Arctogadus glacialis]